MPDASPNQAQRFRLGTGCRDAKLGWHAKCAGTWQSCAGCERGPVQDKCAALSTTSFVAPRVVGRAGLSGSSDSGSTRDVFPTCAWASWGCIPTPLGTSRRQLTINSANAHAMDCHCPVLRSPWPCCSCYAAASCSVKSPGPPCACRCFPLLHLRFRPCFERNCSHAQVISSLSRLQ